jgi:spore maturation protein CgeB
LEYFIVKILVICSSLDLSAPLSCTPSWWQLLKGLYEEGADLIVMPYHGNATDTLWWRALPNPCATEGALYERARPFVYAVRSRAGASKPRDASLPDDPDADAALTEEAESAADRAVRVLAQRWVRPRWRRALARAFERERDIDAVLMLTVPLNQLAGIPAWLRDRYQVPVVYYDGDLPASLPSMHGFRSGFRIYQGVDVSEYSAFIGNSVGGVETLRAMGARAVHMLPYAADPEVFAPLEVTQDIDAFFYGHGVEYRKAWIERMVGQPSMALPERHFAVRGTRMLCDLGRAEQLPYLSFSKLREWCCRSKLNLSIPRASHTSVYGSATARPFELAALGCCIVSSPYPGIEEWFEPGHEMIVLDDTDDAVDVYRRLLADDAARREIGTRARERVLAEHTFRHRARSILAILAAPDAVRGGVVATQTPAGSASTQVLVR